MSIPGDQASVAAPAPPQRNYFSETQQPIYSAALVLPFMLIYQIGLVVLKSRVINGGDAIITTLSGSLFHALGVEASFASIVVPICAFLFWQFRKKGTWTIRPPVLFASFFESLIYAVVLYMLLGYFVHYLPCIEAPAPAAPVAVSPAEPVVMDSRAAAPASGSSNRSASRQPGVGDFVLYCGAGVYEELVFRVFLLGLLLLIFTKIFHMEHAYAAAWSALTGAIIFSAFHHIGGEPYRTGVFLQRVLAGIYFSALYFTRSFGVAAASHAMYDIIVGLDQWKHH